MAGSTYYPFKIDNQSVFSIFIVHFI